MAGLCLCNLMLFAADTGGGAAAPVAVGGARRGAVPGQPPSDIAPPDANVAPATAPAGATAANSNAAPTDAASAADAPAPEPPTDPNFVQNADAPAPRRGLVARMRANQVLPRNQGVGINGESVILIAVSSNDPADPNKEWSRFTPAGRLELTVDNPDAQGVIVADQVYEVTITPLTA